VAGQVRVALGAEPAELVIRGARLVNVFTEQVEPPGAVAVARGRVASLGPELEGWTGPATRVVEAEGRYLLPGLIDAHTHLDSIYTLAAYAPPAVASGNTAAVSEAAMMAGAWGAAGVRALAAEAEAQPLRVFWTVPPLCPPFPALEDSAGLGPAEAAELLRREDFVGVGEAYWPAVTDGDPRVGELFALAQRLGKSQEGHAAGARGERLAAYAASGVASCHEAITGDEALARLRLGLAVQVRQGFVRKEMDQVVPALAGLPDTRRVMLVTDAADPAELLECGAMNPLLARAVELGVPPARAVAWCSLNPAAHFGLWRLGGLAPGWIADMVLVDDLASFRARRVFLAGREAAADGRLLEPAEARPYPAAALHTVSAPELSPDDLQIPAEGPAARVRVCRLVDATITREDEAELPVADGAVQPDPAAGVLKLVHVNRRAAELQRAVGFTAGWGLAKGALATTLQWDTCNLVAVGASDADICVAANRLRELGGGVALAVEGAVAAELAFPLAGIISPLALPEIVAAMDRLQAALAGLGCALERPLLAIQTVCFTGLPFLRLTNRGLVDVRARRLVPVVK
jgi:adenine deaminase